MSDGFTGAGAKGVTNEMLPFRDEKSLAAHRLFCRGCALCRGTHTYAEGQSLHTIVQARVEMVQRQDQVCLEAADILLEVQADCEKVNAAEALLAMSRGSPGQTQEDETESDDDSFKEEKGAKSVKAPCRSVPNAPSPGCDHWLKPLPRQSSSAALSSSPDSSSPKRSSRERKPSRKKAESDDSA
ncbi:MAG: hypothetical protein M4579_005324 [Chaenotheca gracillima]|nr:MAG: hypothetical protein M4579_005324 [Chaenotheca gracillima]